MQPNQKTENTWRVLKSSLLIYLFENINNSILSDIFGSKL